MTLGIDLGTSNTLVAAVGVDGNPFVIPDIYNGKNTNPSCVIIEDKKAIISNLAIDYSNAFSDKLILKHYKRKFGTNDEILTLGQNKWYSESIAAMMLKKITFDAEMFLQTKTKGVVISVPSHFNDSQRQSVLNAANLAELTVLGLIEEPIAAALNYLHSDSDEDELILIYDFGGGTFDISVVTQSNNQIIVIGKDGLNSVGGKEFDEIIAHAIIVYFEKTFNRSFPAEIYESNKLAKDAERIKIDLCNANQTEIATWLCYDDSAFEFIFSLEDFRKKSEILIHKTEKVVARCLKQIGIKFSDVNKIVFVGGTSSIPFIKSYWKAKINEGQELIYHNPMESIALGAALYASSLEKGVLQNRPLELKSVSSYNIALRFFNQNHLLIHKNSPLPIEGKKIIRVNPADNVYVDVIQYWDEAEPFEVGGTLLENRNRSEAIDLEILILNRIDGTIGMKVVNIKTGETLPLAYERRNNKSVYDYYLFKKQLDSIVINNVY